MNEQRCTGKEAWWKKKILIRCSVWNKSNQTQLTYYHQILAKYILLAPNIQLRDSIFEFHKHKQNRTKFPFVWIQYVDHCLYDMLAIFPAKQKMEKKEWFICSQACGRPLFSWCSIFYWIVFGLTHSLKRTRRCIFGNQMSDLENWIEKLRLTLCWTK